MEPVFELDLNLPEPGSRRLLHELHVQLKAAILDGRLKPGLRLPSTRMLADRLQVSRNTAVAAYELLLGEGYVASRAGAGNFISNLVPALPSTPAAPFDAANDTRLSPYSRSLAGSLPVPSGWRPAFDFEVGVPDVSQFRFDLWDRLSTRSIRALSRSPARYGNSQGHYALRAAIARHVSFTRAVACSADSIVVTNGAQQAFDLLARTLVTPGKTTVAVESPGYLPTQSALEAAGAKIVPVRVDEEGIRIDEIPPETRVVSVSPSHQFPLGCVLSAPRRAALIEFVRKRRAVVIEDDYDGEFRFGGRPLDALQTLDRSGSVFYVGTFTKSLFPALRIGFVVAPPWALPALVAAKYRADRHCDVLVQATLASFINDGHLARHLRKMRSIYAERRQRLCDGLKEDFAPWLRPIPGIAGLHLAALARPGVNPEAIVEAARLAGVRVYSLRTYAYASGSSGPAGLLFGYGAIDVQTIGEGLARLRRVMPG
jgi:GntR family transcriptional regulator / MocR family aminotransferase